MTEKTPPAETTKLLPKRSAVPLSDQWDLSQLFSSDDHWEAEFERWQKMIPQFADFRGKLHESAQAIASLFRFSADADRLAERLGSYAGLKSSGDQADSVYQRMKGRFQHAAVQAGEAASYISPELLAIPAQTMDQFLAAPELAEWKLALERTLRYRPHTLTNHEEQILALSGQMSSASNTIFRQLIDTDLKWPVIADENGASEELGHSSLQKFLLSPDRSVRSAAFHAYYNEYEKHKNTLAASYNASLQRDVFYSKVRHYPSARESSLFDDNVPVAVYDALIDAVHKHLPTNHKYLALRRRALNIPDVHMYDTYVPIVSGIHKRHTWDQAANLVCDSLAPLGGEYTKTLREGLTTDGGGRWSDRYPNAGKASGAFSAGGFDGPPYILMNFKEEVLDHVFTLAHEAGHSMHTWFSARHQPYQYYGYVIFVAEVASTFNEQLLLKYLLDRADSKNEKAYLLNHAIDEIRGTIIRQTMFAEYEKISHAFAEAGEPLTVDLARKEYRKLLEKYFGVPEGNGGGAGESAGPISGFVIDPALELECLRIPHFYRAFYVYKYATGLSAAIALSQRVLSGGKDALRDYHAFLKGGCSKWPLDLLRDAGVDMEKPAPVEAALTRFADLVNQLDALV